MGEVEKEEMQRETGKEKREVGVREGNRERETERVVERERERQKLLTRCSSLPDFIWPRVIKQTEAPERASNHAAPKHPFSPRIINHVCRPLLPPSMEVMHQGFNPLDGSGAEKKLCRHSPLITVKYLKKTC